ncbi:DUF2007 domain-containing protein [Gramella sp. AN32]|uniref:Signal transducing protein n=1 Tax=Christiangramia antarctica TaxID=2058158 RepID=A0ABW5X3X5_9FLAO|nr:DUF2007 domain-containing protein [Gramella sp. AN32]MCM4154994.1 hypothetical protein [Gramella sp. AN32]
MKSFVCIASYTSPHEYYILQNKLQDAEINHYFSNEQLVTLMVNTGGIRLMIHPDDLEEAMNILKETEDDSKNLGIV